MSLKNYIINDHEINFKETLGIDAKFGCEIEFDSKLGYSFFQDVLKNYDYKVCRDMSGVDIIEVISPILKDDKNTWKDLKEILNIIKSNGGRISWQDGGHIHYDASIIKDYKSFLKLWYVCEDIIYKYSRGDLLFLRPNYLRYAKKIGKKINNNINSLDSEYYLYSFLNTLDKHCGINFKNHTKCYYNNSNNKNTIEVRVLNGSLNHVTWMNNVLFFYKLFELSKEVDIVNELYNYGKLSNNFDNAHLLGKLLYEEENDRNNFLKQYIKRG